MPGTGVDAIIGSTGIDPSSRSRLITGLDPTDPIRAITLQNGGCSLESECCFG